VRQIDSCPVVVTRSIEPGTRRQSSKSTKLVEIVERNCGGIPAERRAGAAMGSFLCRSMCGAREWRGFAGEGARRPSGVDAAGAEAGGSVFKDPGSGAGPRMGVARWSAGKRPGWGRAPAVGSLLRGCVGSPDAARGSAVVRTARSARRGTGRVARARVGSFLCILRFRRRGFGLGGQRGLRRRPWARWFGGGALEFLDGGQNG
jgi:hypothetical protein